MINAIFINARAKSLETKLLGEQRLNRMIECQNADEALKILSEVNYGEGVVIESALDFEKLINGEENSLFSLLKEYSIKSYFSDYILVKNDYHNAQVYIRSKYLKTDLENMTVCEGNINKDLLKNRIMQDDYSGFNKFLANALSTCDELFVSSKATGVLIDSVFKKALYNELVVISSHDSILKNIQALKADCINIGIAFRLREINSAKEQFVDGGTLKEDELKTLCLDSMDAIKDKFSLSPRKEFVLSALNSAISNKPLSDFEQMVDNYVIDLLRKNRFEATGISPFMLYVFYKLIEMQNVRIVMVGLLNHQNQNDIKSRLRVCYEG